MNRVLRSENSVGKSILKVWQLTAGGSWACQIIQQGSLSSCRPVRPVLTVLPFVMWSEPAFSIPFKRLGEGGGGMCVCGKSAPNLNAFLRSSWSHVQSKLQGVTSTKYRPILRKGAKYNPLNRLTENLFDKKGQQNWGIPPPCPLLLYGILFGISSHWN